MMSRDFANLVTFFWILVFGSFHAARSEEPVSQTRRLGHGGQHAGYVCFSASATVLTQKGDTIPMKDVAVGEKVLTDAKNQKYEEIYSFAHRDPNKKATFLRMHTNDPTITRPIEITADHMLQVNGRFVKASAVEKGDELMGMQGVPATVTKVEQIARNDGVYAPLTKSGVLFVDNIFVSAYASLPQLGDEYPAFRQSGLRLPISQQTGIQMMLSPYRMLCIGFLKVDGLCHSKNEEGISFFVGWGAQLAEYADTMNVGELFILLVFLVVLIAPIYILECIFGARYAPFIIFLAGTIAIRWWTRGKGSEFNKPKNL